MEPLRQVEIQLGHLCNNRCVFCTSGQRTALGAALPLPVEPFVAELRAAYAAGHRKVTFLGGEPTLAPGFLALVREAASLGFDEVVVFSNGVKTARPSYLDALLEAAGPRLRLRLSFQGADEERHEATTGRPGSFARLLRSLENAEARRVPVSVNLCAVRSNFASLDRFPALFAGRGVTQLHVDMLRPNDAGDRTPDELRAMTPRFTELAPVLLRMVEGFPASFDVNVGNMPYCVEPRLAPYLHHDGEETTLFGVSPEGSLEAPCDKYAWKRARDKVKPAACAACVLDARCTGVTTHYAEQYGTGELRPLGREALLSADPLGRALGEPWAPPPEPAPRLAARLERLRQGAPFPGVAWTSTQVGRGGERVELELAAEDGARALFWLDTTAPELGYRLRGEGAAASEGLRRGLRAVFALLAGPSQAPASPPRGA